MSVTAPFGGSDYGIGIVEDDDPMDVVVSKEEAQASEEKATNEHEKLISVDEGSLNMNPMAYTAIIQDLARFRSGGLGDTQMFDFPGQVFFRILFHFWNGSDAAVPSPRATGTELTGDYDISKFTGLLGPTWMFSQINSKNRLWLLWNSPTAWSYFMLNDDEPRAHNVRRFVELLSNINTYSPWYFQSIKGLDEAVQRKITSGDFTFDAERQHITIDCIEDSYDQRIGTLLDLYRSFVWSWETKREMLPANLRKFDMTIIAFQMPIKGMHISRNSLKMSASERRGDNKAKTGLTKVLAGPSGLTVAYADGSGQPIASFKAFEFHGCEIDYNTTKSGWTELSNELGSVPKYSIEIKYDDMFETRFNEFMGAYASDLGYDLAGTVFDTNSNATRVESKRIVPTEGKNQSHKSPYKSIDVRPAGPELPEATTATYETNSGLGDQIIGHAKAWVGTKVKKIYLGNIAGFSIARTKSMIEQAMSGDLFGTISNVTQAVQGNWDGGNLQPGENIFKQKAQFANDTPTPPSQNDIYPEPKPVEYRGESLGNLYDTKSRVKSKFNKSISLGNLYDIAQKANSEVTVFRK